MQYYEMLVSALEQYFAGQKDWKSYFTEGGCYWFASRVCDNTPGAYLMVDRGGEHCAVSIGAGVYDIGGKVCRKHFHPASDHEVAFMRKHYVPQFDTSRVEAYLQC